MRLCPVPSRIVDCGNGVTIAAIDGWDIIEVETRGSGRLARIFSLVYMGDYISTYLGLLNGLDPSSNLSIDELKKV